MLVHTTPHVFPEESLTHVLLASCETVKNDICHVVGKKVVAPDHFLLRLVMCSSTTLLFVLPTPGLILLNANKYIYVTAYKLTRNMTICAILKLRPIVPALEKMRTRI